MTSRAGCLWFVAAALLFWPAGALAAPGDLDPTFSGDGKHTVDLGGDDAASAVALGPGGEVMLAGHGFVSFADADIALLRLTAAGAPDTGFDGDGVLQADLLGRDLADGVVVQPDGKPVVAGSTTSNTPAGDALIMRRLANGDVDEAFSAPNGLELIWTGGGAAAVLLLADGRLILAGGGGGGDRNFLVSRLNSSGFLDMPFGTRSFGFTPASETAAAAAVQPDGKVVLAGSTNTNISDWLVTRVDVSGAQDTQFGTEGWVPINVGSQDFAGAVLVQPDGKIVVVGGGGPGGASFAAVRLNPNGTPDAGFGNGGTAFVDFGLGSFATAAVLQPDGKIVLAGTAAGGGNSTIGVARLQPNGSLDTTFSGDGKANVDFGPVEEANALARQPDGALIVAGSTAGAPGAPRDIAVARLQGDAGSGGGPGGPGGPQGPPAVPRCAGKRATVVGTVGRDRLRGTRRADVIVALGGNDRVRAGGGNDLVCGGDGKDSLAGEAGKDRLFGQGGGDRIAGGPGNDLLGGGAGNDRLAGDAGTDRLFGESGKDRLGGGGGRRDLCIGGSGRDRASCERERQ